MRPIVDTSHFWMSDHSRFWYHLVGQEMANLGAILISDTGKDFKYSDFPKEVKKGVKVKTFREISLEI